MADHLTFAMLVLSVMDICLRVVQNIFLEHIQPQVGLHDDWRDHSRPRNYTRAVRTLIRLGPRVTGLFVRSRCFLRSGVEPTRTL